MKLQALRFALRPQPCGPLSCDLDEGTLRNERHDRDALPVAYVVRVDDLKVLRELKDLVVDCKSKDPRKQLSAYLFGQDKAPMIVGRHTVAGQLIRSVRQLLDNAGKKDERNVFVIGADDAVFAELLERASESPAGKGPRSFDAAFVASCAPPMDAAPLLKVPGKLVRRVIGDSPEMGAIRQFILRAARMDAPVLITGENGTGKDVVAKAIHEQSDRRTERFVPVNCAGIPGGLLESELFGHTKGAFTGADRVRRGLWILANKGTLFLDEVGDLPLHQQAKVLRVLDSNEIWPVGAEKSKRVNVRIVAATNHDLLGMVDSGRFREDLYYRLRGLATFIPPFRDRRSDIPPMAIHFWRQITGKDNATLPDDVLAELQSYPWPGNAREIRSALQTLYSMFGGTGVKAEQVRSLMLYQPPRPLDRRAATSSREIARHHVECFLHLRRAIDVIRACKVSLRPIVQGKKTDEATVDRVGTEVHRRLEELEVLCQHPLLFHGEETFVAVSHLKGELSCFEELLSGELAGAMAYWKQELAGQFKRAQHAIFEE